MNLQYRALAHLHLALAAAGWPAPRNPLPDLPKAVLTAGPDLRKSLMSMLTAAIEQRDADAVRMWAADAKTKAKAAGGELEVALVGWLDENVSAAVAFATRNRDQRKDMDAWQGFVTEIAKHYHRAAVTGSPVNEEQIADLRAKADDTAANWDLPHLALALSARIA